MQPGQMMPGGGMQMPGQPGMAPVVPQAAQFAPAQPPAMPPGGQGGAPGVDVNAIMTRDVDMESIRKQAEEISAMNAARKKDTDFYSFKTGDNWFRVLPPWSDAAAQRGAWSKFHCSHHQLLGNQHSSCWEKSYPNYGFTCPICQVIDVYSQYMGGSLDNMTPRSYQYVNSVIYDTQDMGRTMLYRRLKPYVLRLPVSVFSGLVQLMSMPYVGSILNLQTGWIMLVKKPVSFQGKNSYTWQQTMQGPLAGDPNTMQQILSGMHDLDSFANFGIPTVEKLQNQMKIAETLAQQCLQMTGYHPEQLGLNLQLTVPNIVGQTHGAAAPAMGQMGMPGQQFGPQAGQQFAPQPPAPAMGPPNQFQNTAPGVGGPSSMPMPAMAGQPATGVPQSAPQPAPVGSSVAAPAGVGPMGMMPPVGGAPAAMAPAPTPAPMAAQPQQNMWAAPGAPAGAPVMGPGVPPGAPMMAPGPMPAGVPVQMPMPAPVPMPMPAPAPQAGALPQPPAMPGQGGPQSPFPPAPAPQQAATSPTDGAGEPAKKGKSKGEAKAKADKVPCPACGNEYSGQRGLATHLNKSAKCKAVAESQPSATPATPAAAPAAVPAPAPAPAPAGMAAPNWQQPPFSQ